MRRDGKPMTAGELNEAIEGNVGFSEFLASTPNPPRSRFTLHEHARMCVYYHIEKWEIDMPQLWSIDDSLRAMTEGWQLSWETSLVNGRTDMRARRAVISKQGGIFPTHEDAHAWVIEQADKSEPSSIYNRVLAVIAALTIRKG